MLKDIRRFLIAIIYLVQERVNKMSDKEQLQIDDQKQMIQGIRVFSPSLYKKVRFVVQNNHLEGWKSYGERN